LTNLNLRAYAPLHRSAIMIFIVALQERQGATRLTIANQGPFTAVSQ
jgi:hypothetical protein